MRDKQIAKSLKMWVVLENDIKIIHQLHIAQAEKEFREKLSGVMGGNG